MLQNVTQEQLLALCKKQLFSSKMKFYYQIKKFKAKKLEKTSIVEALRSKKQKNCNISQFPQFLYMITINEALKLLGLL